MNACGGGGYDSDLGAGMCCSFYVTWVAKSLAKVATDYIDNTGREIRKGY